MQTTQISPRPLYLFLDEGGNLDFSPSGTRNFTLTCVAARRPFAWDNLLNEFRYDLLEQGLDIDRFHATEDRQAVRDRVFGIIQASMADVRVDCVVVEKAKTEPWFRDDKHFYPQTAGYLLKHVIGQLADASVSELIVMTDRLPHNKKRQAVEKAVKLTLVEMLPEGIRYRLCHHESMSCYGLQVADYFNWAIYRAWEQRDQRSLVLIGEVVKSQIDIFEGGDTYYYGQK